MEAICWLADASMADRAAVGGKGLGLARLMAAGFDVPDGFAMTIQATASLDPNDTGSWSAATKRMLLDAYEQLAPGAGAVAVRSSAHDEDGFVASYAGQHETVLNVRGADALLEAVAACLASLHSDSADAYRERRAPDDFEARMAVIVQRMVAAEFGGVVFTANPVTGDHGEVMVEAIRGLGDRLVSGAEAADRVVLGRPDLRVLDEPDAGPCRLPADLARKIARVALAVEASLGCPQDIEFAVQDDIVWLLQARPITGGPRRQSGVPSASEFDTETSDADVWTSANIQEVLPGLLTPLTITTFVETARSSWIAEYRGLRLLARGEEPTFVGFFANRAFLNISSLRRLADRTLFTRADTVHDRYFSRAMDAVPERELEREAAIRRWRHRLWSAPFLIAAFARPRHLVERAEAEVREAEARVAAVDTCGLSDRELSELRGELNALGAQTFRAHLRISAAAAEHYERLVRAVRPVLGEETEGRVPVLLTGLDDVESAKLLRGLWALSRIAISVDLVESLEEPDFDPLDMDLPAAWLEALEGFLEEHGHRATSEMDPHATSWRRDPSPILRAVALYAGMHESESPTSTLERQRASRLSLADTILSQTPVLRRRSLRWRLKLAQQSLSWRERTKSAAVRSARLVDYYLPELQQRLSGRSLISSPDDLFYLTSSELAEALEGHPAGDLGERIARRRAELDRNVHLTLTDTFQGSPRIVRAQTTSRPGACLVGSPVCPGEVTGRARVVLDPTDGALGLGEVLVAPVTDAGWTPLFATAAALVVDLGSVLSHGSIVAREYGLPTVVNVHEATKRIATGDLVLVNGERGTVTILERAHGQHVDDQPREDSAT